ncbi:MAG: ribonuclease P protein component [bacterium]|nr:ribonuclease P protein component [bacterium]
MKKEFETFKLNKDFRRLYNRGESFVGNLLVTYAIGNPRGKIRIGITVSKKLGGAVQRNRAKRLIMAAWRNCLPEITSGCNIVFVARTKILYKKSTDVEAVMRSHLQSAGYIKKVD